MDRSQQCFDFSDSSAAMLRRALVVGCAAFLITWHFLPRSADCRVVTISLPSSMNPKAVDVPIAAEPSVRRFIIRVGSPEFKRLEELAADSRKTRARRIPLEFYAEQWRMTAAQYYYERDLQREKLLAATGSANVGTSAAEPERTFTTVAPASFETLSETASDSATFGSSYWQREGREAKARQQALLASLPVAASSPGPTITFGERIAGRPAAFRTSGAAAVAVLSTFGMWWLQRFALRTAPVADCRPRMELHLPTDWIRQSRPLGQRVVRSVLATAWLIVLGCLAMNLR